MMSHPDTSNGAASPDKLVELFDHMLPPWGDTQAMRRVLDEASTAMSLAAQLHSRGEHRHAFILSIQTAVETFKAFGASREQLVPFRHLAEALLDLERGRVNPALAADPERIQSPPEETAEWSARACLAGALQARMRRGEKALDAAREIGKKINIADADPRKGPLSVPKRLVEWRRNFLKDKIPIAGDLFKTIVRQIDGRKQTLQSQSDYHLFLANAEKMLIAKASEYRSRLG
jgi:hypothetical protein